MAQRVITLVEKYPELSDLVKLHLSQFPPMIFSTDLELSPKIMSTYTKETGKIYQEGFLQIKSPLLYAKFLRTFMEFVNILPHGIKADFMVPEHKVFKDLITQLVQTGSIHVEGDLNDYQSEIRNMDDKI